MSTIPDNFSDLSQKKTFAQLATVMQDGSPQVTPVWWEYDGKHIVINSAKGRTKDRNMRRNPNVAISVQDPDNPYRHLSLKGRVVEITENGADAHIDKLSKKYTGKDVYPNRRPGEVRVIYRILPEKIFTKT
jgi:PPOX class probable F420-dependent enzyme